MRAPSDDRHRAQAADLDSGKAAAPVALVSLLPTGPVSDADLNSIPDTRFALALIFAQFLLLMPLVPRPGLEPGRLAARDFKSRTSTNFVIGAALTGTIIPHPAGLPGVEYATRPSPCSRPDRVMLQFAGGRGTMHRGSIPGGSRMSTIRRIWPLLLLAAACAAPTESELRIRSINAMTTSEIEELLSRRASYEFVSGDGGQQGRVKVEPDGTILLTDRTAIDDPASAEWFPSPRAFREPDAEGRYRAVNDALCIRFAQLRQGREECFRIYRRSAGRYALFHLRGHLAWTWRARSD